MSNRMAGVYIPSSEPGYKIPDPPWCLALNALSLFSGFLANIILLLNLAKRIHSPNLQPFIIILWYLASILLIALLAVYTKHLYRIDSFDDEPDDELDTSGGIFVRSQAFYYAIIAAALYFIIATLLLGNYLALLTGRYAKQFTLTVVQRTLMLQTLTLMLWLCLGAGVFSKLEGWAFLDGIYFCDTTFLVVGLGDFYLTTNAGRALLFPYAAVGVVMIGLVVSSIRGLVLERGKRNVKRRFLEKEREKYVAAHTPTKPISALDGASMSKQNSMHDEGERERFELMRRVQHKADQRRKWMALGISLAFFVIFWLLGAYVFMKAQVRKTI